MNYRCYGFKIQKTS